MKTVPITKPFEPARSLGEYLAREFGVPPTTICSEIGLYWELTAVSEMPAARPPLAMRSVRSVLHIWSGLAILSLRTKRKSTLDWNSPVFDFRVQANELRSTLYSRRGARTVALVSSKWRYRHDRVEFIEEFNRYLIAARLQMLVASSMRSAGEFSAARLSKALAASQPRWNSDRCRRLCISRQH